MVRAHALALLTSVLLGCATAPARTSAAPLPTVTPDLVVLVLDSDGVGLDALSVALKNAGYRVTQNARDPHDLSVRLSTSWKALSGANDYLASLEVFDVGSTQADVLNSKFRVDTASGIRAQDLASLVAQLAQSRAVATVKEGRRVRAAERADVARKTQDDIRGRAEADAYAQSSEESRLQREQEEAWARAGEQDCKAPTTIWSCRGVEDFLSKHTSGAHVQDARILLASSEPTILALRDDDRFVALGVALCAAPKVEDACDGVEPYLKEFPNGRHATAAREALTKSAPTIARLRAQAQARRQSAAAASASNVGSPRQALFTKYHCTRQLVQCPGPFTVLCDPGAPVSELVAAGCQHFPAPAWTERFCCPSAPSETE